MQAHRFGVGQIVWFTPVGPPRTTRRDSYKVVRLLPAEAKDHQYRIKSEQDGHERVVKESQLS